MSTTPQEPYPGESYPSYPPDRGGYPPDGRGGSGIATAALVFGIVGLILSLILIGGIFDIVGIILALVALSRIRRGVGSGRGRAIGGMVTSIIGLLFVGAWIWGIVAFSNSDLFDCWRDANTQSERQACVDEAMESR